jgi:hypothetical protein
MVHPTNPDGFLSKEDIKDIEEMKEDIRSDRKNKTNIVKEKIQKSLDKVREHINKEEQ